MINVKDEIRRYEPLDMDASFCDTDMELKTALNGFSKVLKRIDKEQYRYSHLLDEILDVLDEIEEDKGAVRTLEGRQNEAKKELNSLLKAIIGIADSLEDIFIYAMKYGDISFREQMSMQWKRIGNLLNQYGITRLEGIGSPFVPTLYVAKEVEEKQENPHGHILEVLRSGYLYRGKLLRKAEVIVNKLVEQAANTNSSPQ
ncbi:MAG TPA: nucleotide exchange factor GrpE [Clostridia bacterium]|nr:nucleotide exchange factor GrpE [Clostridia bacterium]